jgi:acyl transferase domain-containing protein/acyl carrier protein
MMAPDGRCKAFDARADGFVRAEGAGVVVLKRLADARADGDDVLAIIRGTAMNQDGRSNGLTAPNGPAQEAVVRSALADARIAPHEVAYVEAHGTGTSLGDPIEMRALGAALGAGRTTDRPLLVGSLKTNIGHLESAAGVASLIKVVLAFRHGEIPAQLHFETPNPHIPWQQMAVEVAARRRPWPAGRRIAGVSSFGFSGTNAHIVLEAAPAPVGETPARSTDLLTLSAGSVPALRALAARWAGSLAKPTATLADLCATARRGRAALEHRLAVAVSGPEQARECLEAFARTGAAPGAVTGRAVKARTPEVAFLFTGQGAQYAGMGRALYEAHPAYRAAIDRCDAALRGLWEHRLTDVLHGAPGGPSLDDTTYTQAALFAVEWALSEVWRAWGVTPAIVMGHSVGEYAAACVAGALDVETAIRMVAARGRLMGALPPGGVMVAVPADEARVREALRAASSRAEIAAINGPESVVVAGEAAAVSAVVDALAARGITGQPLRVSHAFHTALMEPMQAEFSAAIAGAHGGPLQVPMVSSVTGALVGAGAELHPAYWVRQVREPVRFAAAMEAVRRSAGEGLWVEIGPHPVLTGLAQPWLAGGEWVPTLRRGQDDWKMLLGAAGKVWTRGVSLDWRGDEPAGRRLVSGLPTYAFERERHWLEPTSRPAAVPSSVAEHPLLGARVRSAAATAHFEARLTATSPTFLGDHRVHGVVIAPSPAMMEMAVAAAAQVLGSQRPELHAFAIEQPLVLPVAEPLVLQTVVMPGEAGSVSIEIASLEDEAASRWRVHARVAARRGGGEAAAAAADLEDLRERCREPIDGADYYAMLAGRGLDFGPCFRGIGRLWRGDQEALAELRVPDALIGDRGAYRVHPALMDACLQALGGAWPAGDDETYLLVGTDRILLPAPGAATAPRFGHAVLRTSDPRSGVILGDVRVLDADGRVIAALEGVHLRRARPESLARARAGGPDDWIYQVEWQPAVPRAAHAASELAAPSALASVLEPQVGPIAAAEGLALYDSLLPALDRLSYQYVLQAFAELGWSPAVGDRVETDALAATLRIERKHVRLLGALLGILTEEGILRRTGRAWTAATMLPPADVAGFEREIMRAFPAGSPEITVTMDCGRALAPALRGQTDPLQLLFAPAAIANTECLYTGTPAARTFNALVARAVVGAIGTAPRSRRIRILEIGAGTGGTTNAILAALPDGAAEYVFTDVSPAFTTRATERLGGAHRTFRPLDIERDPAGQGMEGERFDIVVAANVIHATRDLRRTLAHARSLLAPGGLLILLEGTARYRWVDLTFGLTDGWWRFSDHDLRSEHALLGADQWRALLEASGFEEARRIPAAAGGRALAGQAVLVARVPAAEPVAPAARQWLVLADRGGVATRVTEILERRPAQKVTIVPAGSRLAPRPDGEHWHAVIDLRALDAPVEVGPDVAGEAATLCAGAVDLIRTLAEAGATSRVWLVTKGAQPIADRPQPVAVAQAPIWGLGRVIALEHPELWGGLVDLDPAGTVAAAAEHVVEAVLDPDEEDQVAHRDGQRYVPRLMRAGQRPESRVAVRPDAAYLVTGGLGGLGLKVARWLVDEGARHLVLLGRHGLGGAGLSVEDAERRTAAVADLQSRGAQVDVVAADVADRGAMTALIASFGAGRPPLRGIVHAAAQVRDEALLDTSAEVLASVMGPKAAGGWLLHELSRELPLDFFVLFSSTTALMGSGRLGHYAAANQFLDALAHLRKTEGRPALSVNWGTWDEMRTASEAERRSFAQAGLLPMRSEDALDAMGRLAAGPAAQATVAAVDWEALIALYEVKRPRPFLSALRGRPTVAPAGRARSEPVGLRARLEATAPEGRRDLVLEHVRGAAAAVLGLDPDRVDVEQGLFDMGMDSLMAVDLKTRLEAAAGQRLPSTLTFNYPTVSALAGFLAGEVLGLHPQPAPEAVPTVSGEPAAPEASSTRDALSEDELAALLAEKLGRIR